ncbi:glycosyltransferase family 1 protein [Olivibacter ginsenosidimutans]|uniref:Glycosyltransferase family 1 protein n=1 Tax=Olivibacter ginsenosidimutans TaxID=1176537 RepID=A0ABP9AGL0_9SPHI
MAKRLKIGVEVQRIFRPKKHGMEVVALELLRALQQLDHINEYILFAKKDQDINCLRASERFNIQLVKGFTYMDWEQLHLPTAVKHSNIDFLHATCNTAAYFMSKPLLLTLHDIIYLEKLDFGGTAYQNFGNVYRRMIVPHAIKHSKYIVTVSQYEKQIIANRFPWAADKIKVIYNAVSENFNRSFTTSELADFRRSHGLPDRFLLFLGNTAPKKNTENVLKSYAMYCKQVSDIVPLVILDYSRDLVLETLKKLGEESTIRHIVFPGYVAMEKMPLMYSSSTIFLYPSLRESFGLPILEAMASGTPVITANTSAMPEVAGDAAVLINPLVPEEITKAIIDLESNSIRKKDLIIRGHKRAAQFNWRAAASELLALYEKMI